jgi:imidazolonepropionase-like amidohydrolase
MRALVCTCLSVTLIATMALSQQQNSAGLAAVYLRCGNLIDGKSDAPRKDVVITVEGDKVTQVSAAPAGRNVIDLSGETCLP